MNSDAALGSEPGFTVLILAAGNAQRFGFDKRSVLVNSTNTLLFESISQYQDIGIEVLVCLSGRAEDDVIESMLLHKSIACLRCVRAEEGMGGTLAEAVAAVGDVPGILVALADMPGLLPHTVSLLLKNADENRLVYPVYQGRRGHPVFFGRHFLPMLKTLSGDVGASRILRENANRCVPVAVEDPGVVLDIDTPEDLRRMEQLLQERSVLGESG